MMRRVPERKRRTERLELEKMKRRAFEGKGYEEYPKYPYFSPDYELPFTHIGTEKQIFLDNAILDHLIDVERVIQKPEKRTALQFEGLPWEAGGFSPGVLCVHQDLEDGLYKMFYQQPLCDDVHGGDGMAICYAQSRDGLSWEKPLLEDSVPYGNCSKTNIVRTGILASGMVYNPEGHSFPQRYLLIYREALEKTPGDKSIRVNLAGSQDGIHWEELETDLQQRMYHNSGIIWDDSIGEWIGYGQHSHHWHIGPRTRQAGRQSSRDFVHWSPREAVISADWDANLEPSREFHEMSIRKIGDLYIGITGEAHVDPQWSYNSQGFNWKDQFYVNLGLYVSRDGIRFQRVGGPEPWVDNGEPGSPDYGFVSCSASGLVYSQGSMIFYYLAIPSKQHWYHVPNKPTIAMPEQFEAEMERWDLRCELTGNRIETMREGRTVGALVLREDGFAALSPIYEEGLVYTKQFVFEGDRLRVNAQCDFGYLKVELLDPEMKPYPGFSAEDCLPVHGPRGQVWHSVTWKDGADVSALWNQPVRIRFFLRECSLYGFQFYEEK